MTEETVSFTVGKAHSESWVLDGQWSNDYGKKPLDRHMGYDSYYA